MYKASPCWMLLFVPGSDASCQVQTDVGQVHMPGPQLGTGNISDRSSANSYPATLLLCLSPSLLSLSLSLSMGFGVLLMAQAILTDGAWFFLAAVHFAMLSKPPVAMTHRLCLALHLSWLAWYPNTVCLGIQWRGNVSCSKRDTKCLKAFLLYRDTTVVEPFGRFPCHDAELRC